MKVSFLYILLISVGFIFCAAGMNIDQITMNDNKKISNISASASSIEFYNQNAQVFYERVIKPSRNLLLYYERFLSHIKPASKILDAGCGIGRDADYFAKLGYQVTAFDGSEEMIKFANRILSEPAQLLLFDEINFFEEFDGIWATATLIHIPRDELEGIINRIYQALKPEGIFFFNFKHGEGEYTDLIEGRTFYYMTEEPLRDYLGDKFEVINIWTTEDFSSKVAHSPDKMWLNVLVKKLKK